MSTIWDALMRIGHPRPPVDAGDARRAAASYNRERYRELGHRYGVGRMAPSTKARRR